MRPEKRAAPSITAEPTDGDITFTDNKAGGKGNDIHLGQSQSNAPLITITGTHSVTLTGGLTMLYPGTLTDLVGLGCLIGVLALQLARRKFAHTATV